MSLQDMGHQMATRPTFHNVALVHVMRASYYHRRHQVAHSAPFLLHSKAAPEFKILERIHASEVENHLSSCTEFHRTRTGVPVRSFHPVCGYPVRKPRRNIRLQTHYFCCRYSITCP